MKFQWNYICKHTYAFSVILRKIRDNLQCFRLAMTYLKHDYKPVLRTDCRPTLQTDKRPDFQTESKTGLQTDCRPVLQTYLAVPVTNPWIRQYLSALWLVQLLRYLSERKERTDVLDKLVNWSEWIIFTDMIIVSISSGIYKINNRRYRAI